MYYLCSGNFQKEFATVKMSFGSGDVESCAAVVVGLVHVDALHVHSVEKNKTLDQIDNNENGVNGLNGLSNEEL